MRHGMALVLVLVLVLSVCAECARGVRVVEHRVGGEEAMRAARRMPRHRDEDPQPGCQPCSGREELYCLGEGVMHDHCCCDMRYYEAFPFVPHTCYLHDDSCAPLAGDCEAYERLRECCCNPLLRAQWSSAPAPAPGSFLLWLPVAALLTAFLAPLR